MYFTFTVYVHQPVIMQIPNRSRVITTLCHERWFYWQPGIKTLSTGKAPVSGNNWRNIACLEEWAALYVRAQKVISFFCPLLFPSPLFWIKVVLSLRFETTGDRDRTCVSPKKHRVRSVGVMWLKGITWEKNEEKATEGDWRVWEASGEDRVTMIYKSQVYHCEPLGFHSVPSTSSLHPAPSTLHP